MFQATSYNLFRLMLAKSEGLGGKEFLNHKSLDERKTKPGFILNRISTELVSYTPFAHYVSFSGRQSAKAKVIFAEDLLQ